MEAKPPKGLLIDITKCVGCGECVRGCREAHGQPAAPDPAAVAQLSEHALTALGRHGDLTVRQLCRHCLVPTCVSVCPVEAFRKMPTGPVVYEARRCMGCRYCMQACAFGIPKYQWRSRNPEVVKCDFCAPRQAQGKPTACAEACAYEATVFGDRDALLVEAKRRIAENPGAYHPEVYGEHTAGGTSMLFLSPVPFATLGFPTNLGEAPLPELTAKALSKIPGIVTVGGAFLFGVWWITHRREEVARAEAALSTADPEERP